MIRWDPWTGCYAASDGCKYCYYYGPYSKRYGQNTVLKTDDFSKPVETVYMPRKKITKYKVESGKEVALCFSTDFLLPEADEWRADVWRMIKERADLKFLFLTKRIERFSVSLPEDWGAGYDNVTVGCSVENQETADARLPVFLSLPIKHRVLCCTPLLGDMDVTPYLQGIETVTAGGETGRDARVCDIGWVMHIRAQCEKAGTGFSFKNTGSRFQVAGEVRKIAPKLQYGMARELGLDLPRRAK